MTRLNDRFGRRIDRVETTTASGEAHQKCGHGQMENGFTLTARFHHSGIAPPEALRVAFPAAFMFSTNSIRKLKRKRCEAREARRSLPDGGRTSALYGRET